MSSATKAPIEAVVDEAFTLLRRWAADPGVSPVPLFEALRRYDMKRHDESVRAGREVITGATDQ